MAGVVAAELAFEELEKEQAVDPRQAKFEGYAGEALVGGFTIVGGLGRREVG